MNRGYTTRNKWKDYSPSFVSSRYNYLAPIYPIFELIFMMPRSIRRKATSALRLHTGDTALEIGCGTGRNIALLRNAVGSEGTVYGIDVSKEMLKRAKRLKEQNNWQNVKLVCKDAGEFEVPEKLNGALFSLSYATMTHRGEVLRKVWDILKPGGRIVIMDAQFPSSGAGKIINPFKPVITLFLKASVLGNPYIKPIEELHEVAGSENVEVEELSMGSYFIASAEKK